MEVEYCVRWEDGSWTVKSFVFRSTVKEVESRRREDDDGERYKEENAARASGYDLCTDGGGVSS